MSIWENKLLSDRLDDVLAEDDTFKVVCARLPSLFGISEKATYLGMRSLGFDPLQSLDVMGLPAEYLEYWNNTDPTFIQWEYDHLPELQNSLNKDIIRLGFMKNMAMFVAKDASIIRGGLTALDKLTKREYDYLLKIRGHYTPGDLLSLERALEPEKHQEHQTIVLTWGDAIAVSESMTEAKLIGEGNGDYTNQEGRVLLHNQEEHEDGGVPWMQDAG